MTVDALRYHRLGWSVVPILRGTKRPPERFPLSEHFERPATEAEIRDWLRTDCNLAVCLGDVSDGLTCRDFDVAASYDAWAASHPGIAQRLPTARTHRGYHVYFTTDRADFDGRRIIMHTDGELKRGGYTLLPQSTHPMGARYRWDNCEFPDDAPFVADLVDAGLMAPEPTAVPREILSDSLIGWDCTVQQAIECSQPTGYGERHRCLFHFVRMLRSAMPDATTDDLREPLSRWLRLARPRVRTKDWRTNWRECVDGWHRVRIPHGATIAAIAERASGTGIDKLTSICQELQRVAGDRPFHLDCRTAGKVLEVHFGTAWRWLAKLADARIIERTFPGSHSQHRAAEYRFLGAQHKR